MTLKILLVLTSLLFIVDGAIECSNRGAETKEADFTMDSMMIDVYKYASCEFKALPYEIKRSYQKFESMLASEMARGGRVTRKLLAIVEIIKDLRQFSELREQVDLETRHRLMVNILEKLENYKNILVE
nr:PREDICTED: uncharacterized protein LOC109035373 [Bemisia tabaci]